jgi:hypothetical protein
MKLEFSGQVFEKKNIKFHENWFCGGLDATCGGTDMTKLIDAFRNFENEAKSM